jgi:hypothetical protein
MLARAHAFSTNHASEVANSDADNGTGTCACHYPRYLVCSLNLMPNAAFLITFVDGRVATSLIRRDFLVA